MIITFLGHAGFCVESEETILIMDPWLSSNGAFDAGWFQFPRNHHLAAFVHEKLQDRSKKRYIYISHEHKDHFDINFLKSIPTNECTFLIPHYRRPELRNLVAELPCENIITCKQEEKMAIPGGYVQLFLDDSELDRDSAILVDMGGQTFLNLNDCKLYDELRSLRKKIGKIDVFAAQFSGATWHPTCYKYPTAQYEAISEKKVASKYETIARALEVLQPRVFLPSAGPACFLDPTLLDLNFQKVNIFPKTFQFLQWLDVRLEDNSIRYINLMPGDVLDAVTGQFTFLVKNRVDESNWESYLLEYATLYETYFRDRQKSYTDTMGEDVFDQLKVELEKKLDHLTLRDRLQVPLYFRLTDVKDRVLKVNFRSNTVRVVKKTPKKAYYEISAPSWEVNRVLEKRLTWEDFSLTFRMRLNREPDVYQTLLQGFLILEPEDLEWFCKKMIEIERRTERITVEANGCKYSVDRYCPHQGADLSAGWIENGCYLVCPRHRWQFDLQQGGKGKNTNTSIHATRLDEDGI